MRLPQERPPVPLARAGAGGETPLPRRALLRAASRASAARRARPAWLRAASRALVTMALAWRRGKVAGGTAHTPCNASAQRVKLAPRAAPRLQTRCARLGLRPCVPRVACAHGRGRGGSGRRGSRRADAARRMAAARADAARARARGEAEAEAEARRDPCGSPHWRGLTLALASPPSRTPHATARAPSPACARRVPSRSSHPRPRLRATPRAARRRAARRRAAPIVCAPRSRASGARRARSLSPRASRRVSPPRRRRRRRPRFRLLHRAASPAAASLQPQQAPSPPGPPASDASHQSHVDPTPARPHPCSPRAGRLAARHFIAPSRARDWRHGHEYLAAALAEMALSTRPSAPSMSRATRGPRCTRVCGWAHGHAAVRAPCPRVR
jgi:hypothetical protein